MIRAIRRIGGACLAVWTAITWTPAAGAGPSPLKDLPGITSTRDLASGLVPLSQADLNFYMRILRAAVDRYQHPTSQDLSDMSETRRILQLEMRGQQTGELYGPTPEEQATVDRGTALMGPGVPDLLALGAGMPGPQWSMLDQKVQSAALTAPSGAGAGVDSPTTNASAESLARAAKWHETAAADRALVAPNVAEIGHLRDLMQQVANERSQKYMP